MGQNWLDRRRGWFQSRSQGKHTGLAVVLRWKTSSHFGDDDWMFDRASLPLGTR